MTYIARTLIKDPGKSTAEIISEEQILDISAPIIILGDPGLGKTELTKTLATRLGVARIPGGTFYRSEKLNRLSVRENQTIVIDGLDEIASSSGGTAVDEVLRKLSKLNYPNFILSCRAADWQGSTDKGKIRDDYGIEPVALLLQAFSYQDALDFLSADDKAIDAENILNHLRDRDLEELYRNPLTLNLIRELVSKGEALPESRADLFHRACELLILEKNSAHHQSVAAKADQSNLLDAGGAVFAHLILSGSTGVADLSVGDIPPGYVSLSELADLSENDLVAATLDTRLFQSAGENLFVPFHRVIAEFLGARWLARSIPSRVSSRRAFQALTFADGVPTSLRGIHAWLAFFNQSLADECIRNDPYGVLRYGETTELDDTRVRRLIDSLSSLAKEDPYFRSEDWSRRSIVGLARPKLKKEIIGLIKHSENQYQLSSLILQALPGSSLTKEIAPELISIVEGKKATFVERINAAKALIGSKIAVNWRGIVEGLRAQSGESQRLALEILSELGGRGFSGKEIADTLLAHQGFFSEPDDNRVRVSGIEYFLAKKLDSSKIHATLSAIASRLAHSNLPRHWRAESDLGTTVMRFINRLLEEGNTPAAKDLWSWLKYLGGERGFSREDKQRLDEFLKNNSVLRREIQGLALRESRTDDEVWMTLVHDLPHASSGLSLSLEDAVEYLHKIASKSELAPADISLWAAIVTLQRLTDGFHSDIAQAINLGVTRHQDLKTRFDEITAPPKRDWQKEEAKRQAKHNAAQQRKFSAHRRSYTTIIKAVADGSHTGGLLQMAQAYLNRFYDLNSEATPVARLREWLGDDLTEAALSGFVKYLERTDLPSISSVAEAHAEGKRFHAEEIMTAGILEMVRLGHPLNALPKQTLLTVLASWWEFPDFNSHEFGDSAQKQLEEILLSSDNAIEEFFTAIIEPRLQANQSHVPGLYQLCNEQRFQHIAGKLALRWLKRFPDATLSTQEALAEAALKSAASDDFLNLVRERVKNIQSFDEDAQRLWMAVSFVVDFKQSLILLGEFYAKRPDALWSLRAFVRPSRSGGNLNTITSEQYEFVAATFERFGRLPRTPSGRRGAVIRIRGTHLSLYDHV